MLLENKNILITGGTRGIGLAAVERFIEEGANVAFTYVSSEAKANEIIAKFAQKPNKIKAYRSDASSFSDSEKLVENVLADFGKIDVLVNNAGITKDNLLLRMTEEQFDTVIANNLTSVFNLTKHVAKSMLRQRSGSIINLTSIVGVRGQAGQANYAASKAGIIGFTKSIADEFGSRDIRCNAISPGFIATDMTDVLTEDVKKDILKQIPMSRMGKAEEVANAMVFLASNLSSYVSGQVLSVCGAMSR